MKYIRSLTVNQSMILVFVSGLLTALVFASFTLVSDLRDRGAMRRDEAMLALARDIGDLIHALQREREGTALSLLLPEMADGVELAIRRADTDTILERLETAATSDRLALIEADTDMIGQIAIWLEGYRAAIDMGEMDAARQSSEMTLRTSRLIGTLSDGLNHARSPALVRHLRTALTLMRAKGDAGLQKMQGLMLLTSDAESPERRVEFAMGVGRAQAGLEIFRVQAPAMAASDLALSERIPSVAQMFAWQDTMARPDGARPDPAAWIAASSRWIEALRVVETSETSRMEVEVVDEVAAVTAKIAWRVALLAGLFSFFGGVAWIATRSVGTSVQSIVRAICRLAVEARGATIATCPQKDLNQISQALRVLRSAQLSRENSHLETERVRSRFDEEVDAMLRSVAEGHHGRRLDVLGLDSANAVLARGINGLLDQLERRSAA